MSDTQARITVKDAIKIAKDHIAELFASDNVKNVGLEEVAFDEAADAWNITVGFSRPWDSSPMTQVQALAALHAMYPDSPPRTYKISAVSAKNGKVLKVVNRQI